MARRQLIRNRRRLPVRAFSQAWKAGQIAGRYYKRWARKTNYRSAKKRRTTSRVGSGVIQAGVNGVSFSRAYLKSKMYKQARSILSGGPLKISRVIETARKEWDAGAQGVQTLSFLDAESIGKLFTSVGYSAVGVGSFNIVLKSLHAKISITNQANANCQMFIYDVEHRHDSVGGSDDVTPEGAWSNGLGQVTLGTGSDSRSINAVGVTPFQSPDFCRGYRVTKVTKVYMELGKSHVHNITINRPRVLNTRMLDDSGAQTTAFKGITHSVLIVARGLPVNDGTTDTLIAMGSGALDIVTEEKMVWNFNTGSNSQRYYLDDNQGTITTEKVMNEQSGAADTYEEA